MNDVLERYSLRDHVAVVTGAGRGIGEGIATDFARAGAKVVVAARRTNEIEAVAAKIKAAGGEAIAVTTDVTDDEAIDNLARSAVDTFGKLTIWVNNAGGSPMRMPIKELPREEWDRTIALNLTSIYVGSVTAAKYMDKGSIINITSGAGTGPVPGCGNSEIRLPSESRNAVRSTASSPSIAMIAPVPYPYVAFSMASLLGPPDAPPPATG